MSKPVYVWGFAPAELQGWPPELTPVSGWPPGSEPILVHLSEAEGFEAEAEAHPLASGRLVTAILWLPSEAAFPASRSGYFDAAVTAGDWESLTDLLACPERFRSAEWAEALPAAYLRGLAAAGLHGRVALAEMPLPGAARAHLTACEICRNGFLKALSDRLSLRQVLFDWITVPLTRRGRISAVLAEGARLARALAALLNGTGAIGLKPAESWARLGDPRRPPTGTPLRRLAASLEQGQSVTLLRGDCDLTIGWEPERHALWLGQLHGNDQERVNAFTLELRRGHEVVWASESDGGRVFIPLAELEAAVRAGADQLAVVLGRR